MTAIKGFKNLVSRKVDEDLMITVIAGDKDTVATRELLDIPNPTLHSIHKNNKIFSNKNCYDYYLGVPYLQRFVKNLNRSTAPMNSMNFD